MPYGGLQKYPRIPMYFPFGPLRSARTLQKHAHCMQYTAKFHGCKNDNFQFNLFYLFRSFAQNIYCGYTLKVPHSGDSNEYPQYMF